jgi:RNA polymerase sigma-70 factor (ECF subfamily)
MSWLIAIVRNKALDVLRLQVRRKEVEFPESGDEFEEYEKLIDASAPSALKLLEDSAVALNISQCMGFMEAAPRQCIALAYYHGLSHSEIAEQIGAPVGSVKSWVRRGLMKLKSCLSSAGVVN